LLRLGTSILSQQKLDATLRELAILRVAKLSAARYEWIQHVPMAGAVGVSEVQIAALDRDDPTAACFSAVEQLVLRFTTEVVRNVRAADDTFMEMARHFSPQEIIELILAIGFYMTMARLMETTGVDIEPPAGTTILDAARQR
jgi:alkylhydroperoxidase family enzyme